MIKIRLPKKQIPLAIIAALLALNCGLLYLFLRIPKSIADSDWQNQNYPELSQIDKNWGLTQSATFFKSIGHDKGAEYAYHALIVAASNGQLPPNVDVHLLGHAVGDMLYQQEGINGIKVCTQDLRNACSHSIVVGYLLDHGIDSIPSAVEACHGAPGGSGAYMMCVHGLGHGVLAYADYDMRKAVSLCDKTGTQTYGYHETAECVGGVTMEMMSGIHDPYAWDKQKANYFKSNDPLAPCDMGFINGDSLSYCYTYLTPHLFEAAKANMSNPDSQSFAKAMTYCLLLPASDHNRTTCLASFGKEFVVLASTRNIQRVTDMSDSQLQTVYNWCKLEPQEGVWPCLNSALGSLYWGGENDPGVSIRFCENLDQQNSTFCFDSLISSVAYYKVDKEQELTSFCNQLPSDPQAVCKKRLNVN